MADWPNWNGFLGHGIPGFFFVCFALWHLPNMFIAYFRFKTQRGPPFEATTYFAFSCCPGFPMEPVIKFVAILCGTAYECYMISISHTVPGFSILDYLHHMVMYFCFGCTAILEMLHHYQFYVPSGLAYVSNILSFAVVAVLFRWHLHSMGVEAMLHQMFMCLIMLTIASALWEMNNRKYIIAAFCRGYFMLLAGIWLIEIAFIMSPVGWDNLSEEDHDKMMLVSMMLGFSGFCALYFVILVWFAIAYYYGLARLPKMESRTKRRMSMNGYKILKKNDDSLYYYT